MSDYRHGSHTTFSIHLYIVWITKYRHKALRIVFAWSDVHLHCFRIHGKEYGSARLGGPSFDADPRQVPLAALGLHRGERFTYIYNFIDHWECSLRLEAILPLDSRTASTPSVLAANVLSRPKMWGCVDVHAAG